jgi:cyclic beta-1,2-glucan synthetase
VIWSIFAHAKLGQADKANQLFAMINPINHALNEGEASTYKVEPYVIAADVYSVAPHVGRGGWTWYTGSAGWMYRAGLEAILGVTQEGNLLRIKPCILKDWQGFAFDWRFGETIYHVKVTEGGGAAYKKQKDVQKISAQEFTIALQNDGGMRQITLQMTLS